MGPQRGTIRARGVMQPRGVVNQGVMRPRQPVPVNYTPNRARGQPVLVNQGRGRARARYSAPTQVRAPQPVMRGQPVMRQPRQRVRGGPRPMMNQQNSYSSSNSSFNNAEDDIIIPSLNSGYSAPAPDYDIIADHEMKHFDSSRQRTGNNVTTGSVTQEEQANLARLPQFIQIQKVVEHDVVDL